MDYFNVRGVTEREPLSHPQQPLSRLSLLSAQCGQVTSAKETPSRDHRKFKKNKHFTHCRPKALLQPNSWVVKPPESPPPVHSTSPAHQHLSPLPSCASPQSSVARERSSCKPACSSVTAHHRHTIPFSNSSQLENRSLPHRGSASLHHVKEKSCSL